MCTAEPLVPEPSCFEVEVAVEKLKRYKSTGTDKFLEELIKQEGIHYILRSTNLLIVFGIRKNCHSSGIKCIIVPQVEFWVVMPCSVMFNGLC
jgi:hypothetical protein